MRRRLLTLPFTILLLASVFVFAPAAAPAEVSRFDTCVGPYTDLSGNVHVFCIAGMRVDHLTTTPVTPSMDHYTERACWEATVNGAVWQAGCHINSYTAVLRDGEAHVWHITAQSVYRVTDASGTYDCIGLDNITFANGVTRHEFSPVRCKPAPA